MERTIQSKEYKLKMITYKIVYNKQEVGNNNMRRRSLKLQATPHERKLGWLYPHSNVERCIPIDTKGLLDI